MKAYIIYENEDWMPPLRRALKARGVPFEEWFVNEGHFDVTGEPPEGVFINRMSPSSHTRGHEMSVEHTRHLLAWLDHHGRRIINGPHVFELEISKVRQHAALEQTGIRTPHTRVVIGEAEALRRAADGFPTPFITKHNRGGKGLGVQLFPSPEAFDEALDQGQINFPPDGVMLLQQYIQPAAPFITRCEFVDGELLYAITSDTSEGFELCPADACRTEAGPEADTPASLFARREEVPSALIDTYKTLLQREGIDMAGIEFVEDAAGRTWTYDINTTSNYSPDVEQAHGLDGMGAVAALTERCLAQARAPAEAPVR
ncbi:MAG: alpha-L-glutamate ligase [Bacteroidetes bacterium]|jgi:glutathione synthase/RimK-type ligase-like ATP-grasp enzyme|nr:alpha-L-glutamate ligase [Bacteroidota bacterium]